MRVLRSEVLQECMGCRLSSASSPIHILFCLENTEWVRLWLLLSSSQMFFIIAACEREVCRAAVRRQSWRGIFFLCSHNFIRVDSHLGAFGGDLIWRLGGPQRPCRHLLAPWFSADFCLILTSFLVMLQPTSQHCSNILLLGITPYRLTSCKFFFNWNYQHSHLKK